MATTYRSPVLTLADMFDELIANGRSRYEAISELRRVLRDRAIDLVDLHQPAWSADRLFPAAAQIIDAFAAGERGAGAVPYLHPEYFKAVVTRRDQFNLIFDLARGKSVATRPPVASADIPTFVRNYIKDNPATASQIGIRKRWKTLHGAHRRKELDAEWKKQAKPKGLLRKRGQRNQIAKSSNCNKV